VDPELTVYLAWMAGKLPTTNQFAKIFGNEYQSPGYKYPISTHLGLNFNTPLMPTDDYDVKDADLV